MDRDIRTSSSDVSAASIALASRISFVLEDITYSISYEEETLSLQSRMYIHADFPLALSDLKFSIGDERIEPCLNAVYSFEDKLYEHECEFILSLSRAVFETWFVGGKIKVHFTDGLGRETDRSLRCTDMGKGRRSPYYLDDEKHLVAYFEVNKRRFLTFVVNYPRYANKEFGHNMCVEQKTCESTVSESSFEKIESESQEGIQRYRNSVTVRIHSPSFNNSSEAGILSLSAEYIVSTNYYSSMDDFSFYIGETPCLCEINETSEIKHGLEHHGNIKLTISVHEVAKMLYQNYVKVHFVDSFGRHTERTVYWQAHSKKNKRHSMQGPSLKSENYAFSAFYRRDASGRLVLTVRHEKPLNVQEIRLRYSEKLLRSRVSASFSLPHYKNTNNELILKSKLSITSDFPVSLGEIAFYAGKERISFCFNASYPLSEKRFEHICKVIITIPFARAATWPIHSPIQIGFIDAFGCYCFRKVQHISKLRKYLALHGPYFIDKEHGLTAFFRQNVGKGTSFTIRHSNITDSFIANFKIYLAWFCSKFAFWINPIVLYEKNCQHYEESARVVFEELIDRGYKDVRFFLSQESPAWNDIGDLYSGYVIAQHTFKHYLYFFRCRRFLGTEALAHALELRCQNICVQRKLKSRLTRYIFLQHGVMYMVSLDSPERSSFRRKGMPRHSFTVVSSVLEAEHFMDYAGFRPRDLIVCGLPKFDKSFLNPGADKILIMPTWRPWEFSSMFANSASTKYIRMINRIIEAVPEEVKEKIIVAPHPLFDINLFTAGGVSSESITSYDVLLRNVALLITDYSSIAYDAFYRGANVIFYWEEKDQCMAEYGEPTHLMLDDASAFGPVCYTADHLHEIINEFYMTKQSDEYLAKYQKIVSFHDGCNTKRLIAAAVERGVVPQIEETSNVL